MFGKSTKVGAIIGSWLALIAMLATITFLILSMVGVFQLDNGSVNHYRVRFIANDEVLSNEVYQRGDKIETDFTVPGKPDDEYGLDYTFVGWDTNGDKIANIVPTRAYRTFDAVAIYRAGTTLYPEEEETSETSEEVAEEEAE